MNGDDEKQKSADREANIISSRVSSGNNVQSQDERTRTNENKHDNTSEGAKGSENESSDAKEFTEKNITSSSQEENQDEDIPEDFFDDFLKEDFMAGLDVVDEDDEDLDENPISESSPKSERKNSVDQSGPKSKSCIEKIDHVKKFRESPRRKVNNDELKRLDAKLEELRKAKPKKIEKSKSGIDADNFDIRRDPEKTRQAIQRDKIKSAKDKEKRLITDIVETGLVPPGMELEVDIDEVRRQDRVEKKLPVGDLREKLVAKKIRSQSRDKPKNSSNKRSPPSRKKFRSPPKRRRSRTPKKDTTTSALALPEVPVIEPILDGDKKRSTSHKSPNQSLSRRSPARRPVLRHSPLPRRSPLHRSPLRQRSPHMRYNPQMRRSPLVRRSPLRRNPIVRRRTRSRTPRNRSRISPTLQRKSRSRSPLLHRRSRSRDHSLAYRRQRDRSYDPLERARRRRTRSRSAKVFPRKEEKLSFLEELAVKLNEAHPPSHLSQSTLVQSAPVPYVLPTPPQQIIAPVPAPVPPPQPVFFSVAPTNVPQPQPVQPVTQQYDQYDQSFFIGISAALPQRERPSAVPRALESNGYDTGLSIKEDVTKLFGDKRINLSDFLAITAKPQVNNSSPVKLQEKIKVIQRCQEAIKLLNEGRFTGPLVVHRTNSYESSKNMTMSPLLRRPIIQLPFTTPGLKKSTEIDFAKCCETLLYRVGIEKTPAIPKEPEKPKVIPPKELIQKEIVLPIFPIKQTYSEPTPIKLITKTFGTQTDKELSSCKECLRRKGILYANCGVQAGNPTLSFSVSTQVTEADFYSMIPKTQSLASLTPAQLLGKQSMISDHPRVSRSIPTQESMSRMNFQVPSPPPPPSFFMPPAPQPPKISQRETSAYHAPPNNQPSATPLMSLRPLFGDNKNQPPFPDNRRGNYNNRF